jgi:hypothetical protein
MMQALQWAAIVVVGAALAYWGLSRDEAEHSDPRQEKIPFPKSKEDRDVRELTHA